MLLLTCVSAVSPAARRSLIDVFVGENELNGHSWSPLEINYFFCTGLLWCLFRGDDQGQRCGGLRSAGRDARQWFSIGNRI